MAGCRTVAIWGSCVSRDAFAIPERADELAERLSLRYYGARSSWISQASRPWPAAIGDLGGLASGFGRRMVEEDVAKTVVDRLVEARPDLVVLDLVDERLPLARIGRTWFTVSEYLRPTELGERVLAGADQLNGATDRRRPRLFAAAVRGLARRLARELPEATFVLNEAPYTTRVGGGTSLPEPAAGWARELDRAQAPMLRTLAAAFGPRLVRATPPPRVCLADPDHRWGPASYHYVPEYYHWLIDTLLAVEPARPGRVTTVPGGVTTVPVGVTTVPERVAAVPGRLPAAAARSMPAAAGRPGAGRSSAGRVPGSARGRSSRSEASGRARGVGPAMGN